MDRLRNWVEYGLNHHQPCFVALTGDDYIGSGDDLLDLLDELHDAESDVAVWEGETLAAVIVRGSPRVFAALNSNAPLNGHTSPLNGHIANGHVTQAGNGPSRKRVPLPRVYGHPVTAILLWMGREGWDFNEAKAALDQLQVNVADNSLRSQLSAGRTGRLPAPVLSVEAVEQLQGLLVR